jgi:hypothetical protein
VFIVEKSTKVGNGITVKLKEREVYTLKGMLHGFYGVKLGIESILPEWSMDSDMIEIRIVSGPCFLKYKNYLDNINNSKLKSIYRYVKGLSFE